MAIPTRFGMGQGGAAGTALFNQILQQQGGAGARPNAFMTRRALDPRTAGSATSLMRQRPPMPQIGLRGIRDITAPTGGGGMTRLQKDLAAKMGLGAQTPPKAPQSLMDRLTPAVGTPAFAGLSEAAATGLQLSGYQDKPITTGQGLGAMFGAGMKAYTAEKKAQAAAELAKQQRETDLAMKMMEIRATRGQALDKKTEKATDREIDMARQFKVDSKGFAGVKTNYRKLAAAATTKNPTGATDIGLIFSYMKMLDPTSVVRGSEYEAAAGASPLIQMLGQYYNQARKGTKLPEATRAQFYQAATEYYAGEVEGQQEREDAARQTADKFGLDADKIVVSAVPVLGSEDYPHVIFDMSEQANIPAGDMFMINGVVYTKDAN